MTDSLVTFEQLYTRYSKDVFRFALWLCGNVDDAKDIASETFVRLWTTENTIRSETIKSYLFTIARNVYLHQVRKNKKFTPLTELHEEIIQTADVTVEAASDLEQALSLIHALPEIDRMIFMMRVEEELSYAEIASLTGLTISAVKVKIFRVRAKLISQQTKL